jgi:hypothetical protein
VAPSVNVASGVACHLAAQADGFVRMAALSLVTNRGIAHLFDEYRLAAQRTERVVWAPGTAVDVSRIGEWETAVNRLIHERGGF